MAGDRYTCQRKLSSVPPKNKGLHTGQPGRWEMARRRAELKVEDRVLIFGGPYSNLQATEAVLVAAKRLKITRAHIICTGDMAAYCGDPVATMDLVRDSGIH